MNMQLPTKPQAKAPMITLAGMAGTGKTSLAAMFPNPVIIQAEESGAVFDDWSPEMQPDLFPLLPRAVKNPNKRGTVTMSTKEAMLEQLRFIAGTEHSYRTLIIDSASSLHKMFEHELCARDHVDNVAESCGGFHKGYIALAEWHGEIMNALNIIRNRGIAVVILSHTGIQRLKDRPDEDGYTVYSLDMDEKSVPVYVNLVDAVFYLVKGEFVKGKETNNKGAITKYGKIVQTGERKLISTGDGRVGYVHAKSRYNMPAELPVPQGENPILQYIKFFNQQ